MNLNIMINKIKMKLNMSLTCGQNLIQIRIILFDKNNPF